MLAQKMKAHDLAKPDALAALLGLKARSDHPAERQEVAPVAHGQLRPAPTRDAASLIARGVVHDHRNRIQSLMSTLNLIRARAATGRPSDVMMLADEAQRLLDGIVDPTAHLLEMISPSVDNQERLELNEALSRMLPILRGLCGSSISVNADFYPGPLDIHCCVHRFENAIINIALNARDAMAGSGKLTIATAPATVPGDGPKTRPRVAVMITDTGCGMSDDVRNKAFIPYFTTKRADCESGLGLMMAKLFAEQSGGAIELQSTVGRGTTICLLLPASPPGDAITPQSR
jgi:two-component system, cell cycle sensor histidine kinase and response regulator CckA